MRNRKTDKEKKFDVALGEVLKKYRETADLTLQEVADKIGVASQNIHKHELGLTAIPLQQLIELAKVYGVTIYDVLDHIVPIDKKNLDHEYIRMAVLISNLPKSTQFAMERLIRDMREKKT